MVKILLYLIFIFTLILIFSKNTSAQPDLVGYWKFDEGSDSTASDSSSYYNDGTLYGGLDTTWTTDCKSGKCLNFDGVNDYVNCGNDSSLQVDEITIEAWVKIHNITKGNNYIVAKYNLTGGQRSYAVNIQNDSVVFYFSWNGITYNQTNAANVIQLETWHHIAITHNGSSQIIYVDGKKNASTSYSGTLFHNTPNLIIGGRSDLDPQRFTNGTIDEVKVWNRALTADEINDEYRLFALNLKVGIDYWAGNTKSYFTNRDLPFLKEAGLNFVRLEFGSWSESNLASLIPSVTENGLEVIGLLMRKDLVDDIDSWGNWVYNTVSTYKDKVKVWEIWNEPNWNTGFGSPGDPVKYTEFLKRAYTKAKEADPNCVVLGGSILGTDDSGLNFLRSMYDNGAKDYMDAVAIHPYCAGVSPLYPNKTSTGKAFWKLESSRNIMIEYSDENKKIWITEMGWATQGTNSVTEELQALYLTQALNLAQSWNWVETFIVYQWMDGGGFYFGLTREKNSPPYTYENFCKPSFFAVKDFIQPITSQYNIIGQLKNKTNDVIQAEITLYQHGTENIITSNSTDANGNYILYFIPGIYDLNYKIIDFFITDFWIKLLSLNITSDVQDLVNYVTQYPLENKLTFTVNVTNNQKIETYCTDKPRRVLINGTDATEVSSLSELTDNTWFYNSSEKKIHMNVTISANENIQGFGWLHTSGTKILNASNQEVILNGLDSRGAIHYPEYGCSQAVYPKDIENISSRGFNAMRISLSMACMFYGQTPGTPTSLNYNPNFWSIFDGLVSASEQYHIWLIIDFVTDQPYWSSYFNSGHGAGMPSWMYDGSWSYQPVQYANTDYWNATADFFNLSNPIGNNIRTAFKIMWKDIAYRYRNNGTVVFSLLNEPLMNYRFSSTTEMNKFPDYYKNLTESTIDAIRSVDYNNHIIDVNDAYFYDGNSHWDLNKKIDRPNIILDHHLYHNHFNSSWCGLDCSVNTGNMYTVMRYFANLSWRYNQPRFFGEFGEYNVGSSGCQAGSCEPMGIAEIGNFTNISNNALRKDDNSIQSVGWSYHRYNPEDCCGDPYSPTQIVWTTLQNNLYPNITYPK
jgi:hypothetical protein